MKLLAALVSFGVLSPAQTVDPNKIFERIKTGGDIAKLWSSFGIGPSVAFECNGGCNAEFIHPAFDPEVGAGKTSILLVTGNILAFHRVLLFHCEPACTYIDHIEQASHGLDVETSVVVALDRRWLVITSETANGSDLSAHGSDWYELQNDKLHHALTVPAYGDQYAGNPATKMLMRFARYVRNGQDETLEFVYHVEFSAGMPYIEPVYHGVLWDDEWMVAYSRVDPRAEFTFDRKRSTIPAIWEPSPFGPNPEQILPYATEALLKIARDLKEPRRAWLKQWITTAGDSREAQQIRTALKASER